MAGKRKSTEQDRANATERRRGRPWLEWCASGVGLIIAVGIVGVLAYEAFQDDGAPPQVVVTSERVLERGGLYVLEVVARNRSRSTAAAVEIEGVLRSGPEAIETARAMIDHVPGLSTRRAGLYFTNDPGRFTPQVRALGYAAP